MITTAADTIKISFWCKTPDYFFDHASGWQEPQEIPEKQ